ncbi:hypothetical protein Salat_1184800 [Sesamum alatum]|uniref:Arabidopsis retrotransposon Orf1 C-terminal domain-containing protein n=1 Tax=Sesamum alatum TaxID=300844 RepID=A0AAE1YEV9_9LAMI|nr:hypothetical protein Salat_1184800 [Sesamum alatum]
MDIADRNRYEGIRSRTITNTHYIDNEVLDVLGISNDVEYLFARLGWHDFMFSRWPAYHRLVREFLSSLRVEGILYGPHVDTGRITCQFRHIEFCVTLAEFNAIFDLPGYEEAQGRNRVDLATCQAMKMITRMDDQYKLLMPDPLPSIPLPDPTYLTV